MSRRPLVLALALALPAFAAIDAASATDLMQTYELARAGDPQLAAAESGRLAQKEGAVQARAACCRRSTAAPRSAAAATTASDRRRRARTRPTPRRSYGVNVNQSVFDFSRYSTLRGQKALSQAADFDLEAANDSLITRTSAAYFNVLVAIETLAAAEAQQTALQKQFDYAQKRLDVGLAPITDVHEARAQYDSARASVITSQQRARGCLPGAGRNHRPADQQPKALPDDFRPELPTDYDAEGWVKTAVDHQPGAEVARIPGAVGRRRRRHRARRAPADAVARRQLGQGCGTGATPSHGASAATAPAPRSA